MSTNPPKHVVTGDLPLANHYKSNMRDLFFNLFEVSNIASEVLGKAPFTTMDEATARDSLTALELFEQKEMAKSWADADRTPLVLDDDGNVHLPEAMLASLKAWYDSGWHLLEVEEKHGGYAAPPSVIWAGFELAAGANANATFYQFGGSFARILDGIGTQEQCDRFISPLLKNNWGSTMVLTEPDAGSDVGGGRSKAKLLHDDVWELEGVKRFITNGDWNLPENIVHMVLARPEGAVGGTKGLSLFIVPKFWVEEDGSLGERNGVKVTGIEHKMGIKASATCELTMGGDIPCRGILVGNVHEGIRQMFTIIENARMSVGMKSMSTLSTAYLNALEYAKERVQGADLKNIMDKDAPRVAIIQHPDVRRMLMNLKCHAEGMRALCFFTSRKQDEIRLLQAEAEPDKEKIKTLDKLNDLLLPLVKGYCSEKTFPLLADALQVFGGSGYCVDYPIEQYIRDQKIDSLYEGTTHIQSLDLLFRKIGRDQGATLQLLFADIQSAIDDEKGGPALTETRAQLLRGLQDVQGLFMNLMGKMGESLYHVGLHGNRVLYALSELVIGWLLVEHAVVAVEKRERATGDDVAFYEGKVAAAQFFAKNVLPGLTLARKLVENGDLSLMDVDEAAFG
ncbi:MAG: acyl-CoA dehydrogenase [Deltaproteobacteria bacterium]|nr:acyl-CoA dehydrogenase [Deltaproteobacteria bacterium]